MESATKLTGFLAAHAIWSVSDGEMLIPMLGFETAEGTRYLHRFVAERVEKGLTFDGPAPDYQVAGSAFFEGVDSHEKAAPIWSRYLDESI